MITKYTLPSDSEFYGKYTTPNDIAFRYVCENDDILTGIQTRSNIRIDGVDKIYCTSPKNIGSNIGQYEIVTPNFGGRKGIANAPFICPAGSSIDRVNGTYNNEGYLHSMDFVCRDINTGFISARSPIYGINSTNPFSANSTGGMRGFSGTGGSDSYIGKLQIIAGDYTILKDALTENGKVKCCMGQYPNSICANTPGSSGCDNIMFSYCSLYPTDPKCACIKSPTKCPNKIDANCMATGYKTFDMINTPCNLNYNDCRQYTNFDENSTVALASVKQICSANSETGESKSTENEGSPATHNNTGFFIGLSILMFVLLIIIIVTIVLIVKYSHKQKT